MVSLFKTLEWHNVKIDNKTKLLFTVKLNRNHLHCPIISVLRVPYMCINIFWAS